MIWSGENYYRIANMHSEMQTQKAPRVETSTVKAVDQSKKDSDATEKPHAPECNGCPDQNTKRCETCLTGRQIYV
jgi:hypothetical protein